MKIEVFKTVCKLLSYSPMGMNFISFIVLKNRTKKYPTSNIKVNTSTFEIGHSIFEILKINGGGARPAREHDRVIVLQGLRGAR
jgi:hypothetical protein